MRTSFSRSTVGRVFKQWIKRGGGGGSGVCGSSSSWGGIWIGVFVIGMILFVVIPSSCDTRYTPGSRIVHQARSQDERQVSMSIVVLTHSRASSLQRLLRSLDDADYEDERVDLHIWVDRSARTGVLKWILGDHQADEDVLACGRRLRWNHGALFMHVWKRHVGIWGQWIETSGTGGEKLGMLILEDDLEVSSVYYKWLKQAKRQYGNRDDIFGYTLQRGTLRANSTGFGRRPLHLDASFGAYLYKLVGSWGYMPEVRHWGEFRGWFHVASCTRGFHPYVGGLLPTRWYKKQESARSMWTMWHIYYAEHRGLFTVYANLPERKTLAANWREPGLHFRAGGGGRRRGSRVTGERDFALFSTDDLARAGGFRTPARPVRLRWNGTRAGT